MPQEPKRTQHRAMARTCVAKFTEPSAKAAWPPRVTDFIGDERSRLGCFAQEFLFCPEPILCITPVLATALGPESMSQHRYFFARGCCFDWVCADSYFLVRSLAGFCCRTRFLRLLCHVESPPFYRVNVRAAYYRIQKQSLISKIQTGFKNLCRQCALPIQRSGCRGSDDNAQQTCNGSRLPRHRHFGLMPPLIQLGLRVKIIALILAAGVVSSCSLRSRQIFLTSTDEVDSLRLPGAPSQRGHQDNG